MLRHSVGCLGEGLFERVPPRRAFGPPVGMTMVGVYKLLGGMATQRVAMGRRTPPCIARTCPSAAGGPEADGHATRQRRPGPPVGMTAKGGPAKTSCGPCRAGHGVCHRGHRGNPAQVGSVVSVILCGLPCPCVLFVLSAVDVGWQPLNPKGEVDGHGVMHGPGPPGHAHPPSADQRRMGMPPHDPPAAGVHATYRGGRAPHLNSFTPSAELSGWRGAGLVSDGVGRTIRAIVVRRGRCARGPGANRS